MADIPRWNPLGNADLAFNYLTRMTDPREDYLPYWLVKARENPPYAQHCRVDDAEIVASWYEALVAVRRILERKEGQEVEDGFKRILLREFGDDGLRYHRKYPWTDTVHCSFHEMSYVLGALTTLWQKEGLAEARERARGLVRGLRTVATERRLQTFWGGDTPLAYRSYSFRNDVYIKDRGWDFSCFTARGEEAIRNGMMLHSLVRWYEADRDEASLDLAVGMANHIVRESHLYSYDGQFFGHVHSNVWIASGLARLFRATGDPLYLEWSRKIHDYVQTISSTFGWVPEYGRWRNKAHETSETCCIKDMIQCALELIACGDDRWDVVDRFARNQLAEAQFKEGSFVKPDNSREDDAARTYRALDERVVGGFTGGSQPNTVPIEHFRGISGCCSGTAPQALALVWDAAVAAKGRAVSVNLWVDKETPEVKVRTDFPSRGRIEVTAKRPCDLSVRVSPWAGSRLSARRDGKAVPALWDGNLLAFTGIEKGSTIEVEHPLEERTTVECLRETNFRVAWRGSHVVWITPEGPPVSLYLRDPERRALREARLTKKATKVTATQQG